MSDDIYYDMNMDDNGDYYEKSTFSKIVSLFFKSIVAIIIIATFAILFWRMWTMKEPSMADDLIVNNTTIENLEKYKNSTTLAQYTGGGWYVDYRTFDKVVLKNHTNNKEVTLNADEYGYNGLEVFSHTLASYYLKNEETGKYEIVERSDYYSVQNADEGHLKISSAYFIPQAGQLEVTFRFNKNALENLYDAYMMSAAEKGEKFVYVITDNHDNHYTSYCYTETSRSTYNYRRLLFSGIDFKNISTLYLDIYYINDVTLSEPYRSMIIYDSNITLEHYTSKIPSSPTSGLIDMPKYYTKEEK
ncbi:MAG: hypothetical protein IJD22_01850 [Clostridia bacterium]|nr:hypothetical protein [Clostridia bacterium]